MDRLSKFNDLNALSNEELLKCGYRYSVFFYKQACKCKNYCFAHGREIDYGSRRVYADYLEMMTALQVEPKLFGVLICKLSPKYDLSWKEV